MGLKKQINLTRYAFQNIRVYRTRTLAILLFFGIVCGLLTSVDFLRDGMNQDIEASLNFAPDILIQGYNAGRLVPVSNSIMADVEKITNVTKVSPRVWGYLSASNKLYTLMGIEVSEYPLDVPALDFEMQEGRFLRENETKKCVIGSGVADSSKAQIGSILLLLDINNNEFELEVIGIFSVSSKIYSHDLILTDINSSREFFQYDENHSTDIAVWTDGDSSQVASVISDQTDGVKVIDRNILRDLLVHSTNERAGFFVLIWFVLLLGSLLFAFTLSSSVSIEARREIGILKSLGFTTMDVLEIRIIEYTLTGFIASTIGIFGAIIYDFYLGAPVLADFMLGWSVVFPPFILPLKINLDILIVAYGLGIIPLLIAVVVPAWSNAITEPEEVLRGL
ncbi:MAG: ABC transporter permease [Candidatus Hodarchaeales archaeon]